MRDVLLVAVSTRLSGRRRGSPERCIQLADQFSDAPGATRGARVAPQDDNRLCPLILDCVDRCGVPVCRSFTERCLVQAKEPVELTRCAHDIRTRWGPSWATAASTPGLARR